MKFIIFFSLSIFLFSCSTPQDENANTFQSLNSTNFQLKATKIPIDIHSRIYDITISDKSGLLFLSSLGHSKLIAVYDLNMNFIGEFINVGEGPEEQLSSMNLQIDDDEGYIYSMDSEKNNIFIYSLDSIKKGAYDNSFIKAQKIESIQLSNPVMMSSRNFVDFDILAKPDALTTFTAFNFNGDKNHFGELPSFGNTIDPILLPNAFSGKINYFPSQERIVVNYYFADLIDVYDTYGTKVHSLHGPDKFIPNIIGKDYGSFVRPVPDIEKAKFAYLSKVNLFEDNYYISYHGRSVIEGELTNLIFKFNSDLKPLKKFSLDTQISQFVIDSSNRRIIAFSMEEDGVLFSFPLID